MSKSGTVRVEELTSKTEGDRERGELARDVLHFLSISTNRQDCEEMRSRLRACVRAIAEAGSDLIDSEDPDARMEELSFSIEVGKKQHRCHTHVVIKSRGKGKVSMRLSELRRIARDHGCPHMNCRYLKTRSTHTAEEMAQILRRYQEKDLEEEAREPGGRLLQHRDPDAGSASRESKGEREVQRRSREEKGPETPQKRTAKAREEGGKASRGRAAPG